MQAQTFQLQQRTAQDLDTDFELDLFAGLAGGLNDPFNVFARAEDLDNTNEPYVYFYAYSLGRKKVIIWGIYEKSSGEFLIDDACKYHPNYLRDTQKIWKEEGEYQYLFNSVKDRFSGRIERMSRTEGPDAMVDYETFRDMYLLLNALHPFNPIESLSEEDLEELSFKYDINEADEDYIIDTLILLRREEAPKIYKELFKYLKDEDYRVAKYLIRLHTARAAGRSRGPGRPRGPGGRSGGPGGPGRPRGPGGPGPVDKKIAQKLRKYVKNTFMDLFLRDLLKNKPLAKKLGGPYKDYGDLISGYLAPQVEQYEDALNRSDLDRKHGLTRAGTQTLKMLSRDFRDWVARSKYNRQSFAELMETCPEPNQCQRNDFQEMDESCAIYYHGSLFPSQWDSGLL